MHFASMRNQKLAPREQAVPGAPPITFTILQFQITAASTGGSIIGILWDCGTGNTRAVIAARRSNAERHG